MRRKSVITSAIPTSSHTALRARASCSSTCRATPNASWTAVTGDGRLLDHLRRDRPEMLGVGLDFSELMLVPPRASGSPVRRASSSSRHNLTEPLPGRSGASTPSSPRW